MDFILQTVSNIIISLPFFLALAYFYDIQKKINLLREDYERDIKEIKENLKHISKKLYEIQPNEYSNPFEDILLEDEANKEGEEKP